MKNHYFGFLIVALSLPLLHLSDFLDALTHACTRGRILMTTQIVHHLLAIPYFLGHPQLKRLLWFPTKKHCKGETFVKTLPLEPQFNSLFNKYKFLHYENVLNNLH